MIKNKGNNMRIVLLCEDIKINKNIKIKGY